MSLEEDLNKQFEEEMKNSSNVNIMVVGGTGVGKSTLVNTVFGKKIAATGTGRPITKGIQEFKHPDLPVVIFDTEGYEIIDGELNNSNFENIVIAEIKNRQKNVLKDQIHLVWYCISVGNHRITDYDIQNIKKLNSLGLKLAIVFTQCDSDELDADGVGLTSKAFKTVLCEQTINSPVFETMTVDVNDRLELPKLIEWSASSLDDTELKHLFIGAQKLNIDLKDQAATQAIIVAISSSSLAAGLNPLPMSDSAIIVPIQLTLSVTLAKIYGFNDLGNNVMSLLKTQVISLVAKQMVASVTKFIPFLGQFINAGVAGTLTAGLGYGLKSLYSSAYLEYLNTGKIPNWAELFNNLDILSFVKAYKQN